MSPGNYMLVTMAALFSLPLMAKHDVKINFKPFFNKTIAHNDQSLKHEDVQQAVALLVASAEVNGASAQSDPKLAAILDNLNKLSAQAKDAP